jgi:hypothetical protein
MVDDNNRIVQINDGRQFDLKLARSARSALSNGKNAWMLKSGLGYG